MIVLTNISKKINHQQVLQDVSLTVNAGDVFALLGPNGSGKTTLMRTLLGLLKPDAGQIELFNQTLSPDKRPNLLLNIGVQNDGNLYENLTVIENLTLWGEIYQMSQAMITQRITELSHMFHLENYLKMPVGRLSKGNRQKVLLARAMFHQPKLLILDEPTSGLDPESIDEFYGYINMLKRQGVTIIMCMHYLYGLDDVIDSLAILKKGRILASGKVETLLNQQQQFEFEGCFDVTQLTDLSQFGQLEVCNDHQLVMTFSHKEQVAQVIKYLCANDQDIYSVTRKKETVKDIYFRLIGGA